MLSTIVSNRPIFRVGYSFASSARSTLSEEAHLFKGESEPLINRLRMFFRQSPLFLFIFYL
jgi:hypothetical protein